MGERLLPRSGSGDRVSRRRVCVAFAGVTLALLASGAPSDAATSCSSRGHSSRGYSYTGLIGRELSRGVAATITPIAEPVVRSGHVAVWVGVGGYGSGPGGADVWLQTGLVARPGSPLRLYVEWRTPSQGRRYRELAIAARVRVPHRLAVFELSGRPGIWRVTVDGRVTLAGVRLWRSSTRFRPIAVAETWDGGGRGCARFAFSFASLARAGRAGAWSEVRQRYRLETVGASLSAKHSGFVARSPGT